MKLRFLIFLSGVFLLLVGYTWTRQSPTLKVSEVKMKDDTLVSNQESSKFNQIAIFAAGCFWCVEAVFENFRGVLNVESGYIGGQDENPTYEQVSSGNTGHAEAIKIEFDAKSISYKDLVTIFFHAHDPTTLNQQGADVGTQYRSAVFYLDETQKQVALQVKEQIEAEKVWSNKIVTEVTQATKFYAAEQYHQDYFQLNSKRPYCQAVIIPKLQKLYSSEFSKLLKK